MLCYLLVFLIEKTWPNVQKSLKYIIDATNPDICIVESNSSDRTLQVLQDWSKQHQRVNIISLGNLKEIERTKRLATCRNIYLKYARQSGCQY